jgi:RNA polymerase sigma-70 factor (ECF subfamily)
MPGGSERDAAVSALYVAASSRLIAVLRGLGASEPDAEEVVQEAFARLWVRWDQARNYDEPVAWVRTVAVRIWISRQRRHSSGRRAVLRLVGRRVVPPAEPDVEQLVMAQALSRLSGPQRTVLVLHYMEDLPVEAIARTLDVPVGTVKSRLSRGRDALQDLLTTEAPDHA